MCTYDNEILDYEPKPKPVSMARKMAWISAKTGAKLACFVLLFISIYMAGHGQAFWGYLVKIPLAATLTAGLFWLVGWTVTKLGELLGI